MSGQRVLQSAATATQETQRHVDSARRSVEPGAYTVAKVLERIDMTRSTFYRLRDQGDLPFLEEVKPRLGRLVRYRADLIEEFVANRFNRSTKRA